MPTPIAYYDADGNPRDARGAIILYIGGPQSDVIGTVDGFEDDLDLGIEEITITGTPIKSIFGTLKDSVVKIPGLGGFSISEEDKKKAALWGLGILAVIAALVVIKEIRRK